MDYNPRFFQEDRRVGEQCFFDDRDVYMAFNADLKSFELSPGAINTDFSPAAGGSEFLLFLSESDPGQLKMEFYVGGPSAEVVQTNIFNLLRAAKKCVIRKEGDVFEYAAVLIDRNSEDTQVEPYYLVTLQLAVVRRKPLVIKQILGNAIIYNEGNESSGAKISLSPAEEMGSFTIMGITIEDLSPGTTYVIDGITGRVTANGINYFAHTNIIDFPKIQPGKNEIEMSEDLSVMISYYPVFSC